MFIKGQDFANKGDRGAKLASMLVTICDELSDLKLLGARLCGSGGDLLPQTECALEQVSCFSEPASLCC